MDIGKLSTRGSRLKFLPVVARIFKATTLKSLLFARLAHVYKLGFYILHIFVFLLWMYVSKKYHSTPAVVQLQERQLVAYVFRYAIFDVFRDACGSVPLADFVFPW